MKLLKETELDYSPVVANNRMNRQRGSSGVNSYEKELGLTPEIFLSERINHFGHATWLDLCCGEGRALVQAANYFRQKGMQEKINLQGIDLIGDFPSIQDQVPSIQWVQRSLHDWQPVGPYDLITIVHGLHYIGDKLKLIEKAVNSLREGGLFVGHLDLDNLAIENKNHGRFFKTLFMHQGFVYNGRTKLLQHPGSVPVTFNLDYLGADDSTGPNYTGQEAVTSCYSRKLIHDGRG